MDPYELMEHSLKCRWVGGAYRRRFDTHYWPCTGYLKRPWLIMISPHQGRYSVIDYNENKTFTVNIDQVVVSVPGSSIQVHQHCPGTQTYAHLHYTLYGMFDPFSLYTLPRVYKGNNGDRVREALLYVARSHTAAEKSLALAAACKESVFKLFRILLETATLRKDRADVSVSFSRIQPVVRYIQEHIAEPMDRKELAALANLSPSRLGAVFKAVAGMPPKQYIQDLRHKKGVDLLQNASLSISDIAEQCGFCDQFEFSRQFKKRWGASPLAYRKALKEQEAFFSVKG